MRKFLFVVVGLLIAICVAAQQKREFRGAWIQCVNGQFQGMGTLKMQQTLLYQLDELKKDGVNAIIFQVRPECDALYQSNIEPWSRFLTGQQGKAPSPYWDPLQWMIEQCHQRGMELHAWINPYRAKTKGTSMLASNHVGVTHPERCFSYDDLLILNPGIPENRDYICQVAKDIVSRYDIDGIHMDDYFYPYPAAGQVIPDDQQYRMYSNGIKDRGDWRRYNVNLFIKQFYETVHATKPWVKVGISPFGIYRNKRSAAIGSNTNGLQNYDDLYADVLLWINNGWLDYCVPQIYWEIGNKAADYDTLIRWWNQHAGGRPLFIGEDIERTVKNADPQNPSQNQQPAKYRLHQQMSNVRGTVLWYAKAAVDNTGNYATMLRNNYWCYPAMQPQMSFISSKTPKRPRKVKPVWTSDGYILFWTSPRGKQWDEMATQYAVYRFEKGMKINTDDPSKLVAITSNTYLKLPYKDGRHKYTYVVTALNRLQAESKVVKKTVKL
ncbi:family 10 glycosylhydrolase [Prevotella sp. E15-22]|uniref:glycoside hydrolase family 10 protein n=1 Tax=Prevotella sp. E15-22 TaxID=2937774 RepID=UPI002056B123|nr:family 10 glycosylhydrolase [Prevotella sp. E15-22]UPS43508.1 family 10 glycosylhydrolase [Prevotella sp. E15-22]